MKKKINNKWKIPTEYCSFCGKKMIYMGIKGAENFGFPFNYNDKYDYKTGKRKMRFWIACPQYSESLFKDGYKHSAHAIEDEFLV